MIPRYTRPEMGRIWSEENRFRNWLKVEIAATETLAEAGMVPKEAARAIQAEVNGQPPPESLDFPTVEDGVEGMAFIAAAVQSAQAGGIWTKMPFVKP